MLVIYFIVSSLLSIALSFVHCVKSPLIEFYWVMCDSYSAQKWAKLANSKTLFLPPNVLPKILVKMSKLKKVVHLLQIQCSNWLFLPLLLKLVIDISASLCLLWNLTEKKSFWQILVMAVNVKWTFLLLFATFSSILQHKNGKKFTFNSLFYSNLVLGILVEMSFVYLKWIWNDQKSKLKFLRNIDISFHLESS